MENERVKKSNLCAQIGFLLTLLNIVVSSAFLITGATVWLLSFTSATAVLSLFLCAIGKSNAKKCGSGKILSIIGIVANVIILLAVLTFLGFLILFFSSCSNVKI